MAVSKAAKSVIAKLEAQLDRVEKRIKRTKGLIADNEYQHEVLKRELKSYMQEAYQLDGKIEALGKGID